MLFGLSDRFEKIIGKDNGFEKLSINLFPFFKIYKAGTFSCNVYKKVIILSFMRSFQVS